MTMTATERDLRLDILDTLLTTCNAACVNNTSAVGDCIEAIDCFNNGGAFNEETGLCGTAENNCHENPLPDFIGQAPADTPQACNAASKNKCTVILDSADGTLCKTDSCP